jgi:tRNA U55 pseudouridine synthase TruB
LAIDAACRAFHGDIHQVPPMHSALKRDGKPLYAYAREGIVLEREARPVTIHSIEVTGIDRTDPQRPRVSLRTRVSKGTYIRTLAEDIGERLGCGAHLVHRHARGLGQYLRRDVSSEDAIDPRSPFGEAVHVLHALNSLREDVRDDDGSDVSSEDRIHALHGPNHTTRTTDQYVVHVDLAVSSKQPWVVGVEQVVDTLSEHRLLGILDFQHHVSDGDADMPVGDRGGDDASHGNP